MAGMIVAAQPEAGGEQGSGANEISVQIRAEPETPRGDHPIPQKPAGRCQRGELEEPGSSTG